MLQKYRSCFISLAVLGSLLTSASVVGNETSRLSPSELKTLYRVAGLIERDGKILDDCNQPVEPDTKVVDLNGDGQSEVFVQISSPCYGSAGAQLFLLVKDKEGHWQSNFGFPAESYKLLDTKNKGYPDIEIGGPGLCFPVWRWNGTQYAIFKRCDR